MERKALLVTAEEARQIADAARRRFLVGRGLRAVSGRRSVAIELDAEQLRELIASTAAGLFPVRVSKVGGLPGDHQSPCTFVYDVWPVSDTTLEEENRIGIAMAPRQQRSTVGLYTWRREGIDNGVFWGYGTGFYDAKGAFVLYSVAGEAPVATACAP